MVGSDGGQTFATVDLGVLPIAYLLSSLSGASRKHLPIPETEEPATRPGWKCLGPNVLTPELRVLFTSTTSLCPRPTVVDFDRTYHDLTRSSPGILMVVVSNLSTPSVIQSWHTTCKNQYSFLRCYQHTPCTILPANSTISFPCPPSRCAELWAP
ncbi:hypothetical protein BC827DRAFT_892310 [Russula dissimulans]|nr:hypothetical protein BC827DRAFT_892310 [Russula dissimulans]